MKKARGIKIKKLHLPLKKMTDKEKGYSAVLLEDVNSNMQAYWEVLSGTQEDVRGVKEEVESVKEGVRSVKETSNATFEEVVRINERLFSVEITLEDIKKEIVLIKNEIKDLKKSLSQKADLARLEVLELKVTRIEKHIKLSV